MTRADGVCMGVRGCRKLCISVYKEFLCVYQKHGSLKWSHGKCFPVRFTARPLIQGVVNVHQVYVVVLIVMAKRVSFVSF